MKLTSIDPKKLYWALVAILIVVTIFEGYNIHQTQKTLNEAKAIKNNLENFSEKQSETCYLKVADGTCIAINQIGFIEKKRIDTVCEHTNCTNQTEYARAVTMLIVEGNLQGKKLILLHE